MSQDSLGGQAHLGFLALNIPHVSGIIIKDTEFLDPTSWRN